jgi:hypothetical protein
VLSRCQLVRFRPRPPDAADADRAAARQMLEDVAAQGVEAVFRHGQSADRDRHRAEALVDGVWSWYRDLLRAKAGVAVDAEVARDAASHSLDDILAGLAACREARRALGVNVSPRLTLEQLLSRLALRAA